MRWFCTALLLFWTNAAADQQKATTPHGPGFDLDCLLCHNTDTWLISGWPSGFDHDSTGFRLTGAHQGLDCGSCHHSLIFHETGSECRDCHTDNHRGEMGQDCGDCHSTWSWENRDLMVERHNATGFPLMGAHANLDCRACHSRDGCYEFIGQPSECIACHEEDFNATAEPDHRLAGFSTDCTECHSRLAADWKTPYTHTASFPLAAGHSGLACSDCHRERYTATSTECSACHLEDYQSTREPDHVAMGFPMACETCHNTLSWQTADFDHLARTGYALEGAHAQLGCSDCHAGNSLQGLSRDCFACHQKDYNSTANPEHAANQFSHDCLECHTTAAWTPSTFDHNATGFPLTGAHSAVNCVDCHTQGYTGTPTDCWSCHQDDFNTTADPDHQGNQFDHDCTLCHTTAAWTPSTFDHNATSFPLTGAHSAVNCVDCHTQGYTGTATDCWVCHQEDFNTTADPDHQGNQFDHDCTLCHTTTSWTPSTFDHSTTAFPLTGAHMAVNCVDCHTQGYTGTATDCWACHEEDYRGVTDPDHATNNFDHDCTLCHTTTAWTPSTFDHNATGFPLTGAHMAVNCVDCHTQGYTGTAADCWACHEEDYRGVTDPDHATNNFDHDCLACHTTATWSPATFDHNATAFPLTGAHAAVNCVDCHDQGYTGTPTDCWACHEDDYRGVADPDHAAGNYNTDCLTCHTVNAWSPASFDHNTTAFPLTGAHVNAGCGDCHAGGYSGTSTDCYACHTDDYNGTDNPNHAAAQFPTDCEACHNTTRWSPADWNHDALYFPIYTGEHRGEWNACTDCHTNPSNYSQFSCTDCHEHRRSEMDDEHDDVSGYSYTSSACYACHPRGEADD